MRKVTSIALLAPLFFLVLVITAPSAYAANKVGVSDIAAGYDTAHALKSDGSLWGWGFNQSGEVGDGTTKYRSTPVKIMDDVAVSYDVGASSLAIKKDGTLWAWGSGYGPKSDDGSKGVATKPVKILDSVEKVESDGSTTYAIRSDGSLWFWGIDHATATGVYQNEPKQIMQNVSSVHIADLETYVIKKNGDLYRWGSHIEGSGANERAVFQATPVKIMDKVKQVAGSSSIFVLQEDGSLWSWGDNEHGVLGDGSTVRRDEPKKVFDKVAEITAADSSVFVIRKDSSLWSWGNNVDGQLGYDNGAEIIYGTEKDLYKPTQIIKSGVLSVSVSDGSTFAVKNDGTLFAWGNSVSGVLGFDGINSPEYHPVEVIKGVKKIVPNGDHGAFAIKNDGSLWAWGRNDLWQLGTGDREDQKTPVQIIKGISSDVVFDSQGGDIIETREVDYGRSILLPVPVRGGYKFLGWYWEGKRLNGRITVTADMILTAKWEKEQGPTSKPNPDSTGYKDVAVNHWVYTQGWLSYITTSKIMSGYNGNFDPDGNLTRGQVAAVLYRIANPESDATTNEAHYGKDTGFKDGGSQHYYYAAVKWLKDEGISTGDKDPATGNPLNRFRPDDEITRQELATFVYRFAQKMGAKIDEVDAGKLAQFRDGGGVLPYAREAMAWCVANGVITGGQGDAAGLVMPGQNATRAQAAKIFTVVHRDVLGK